MVCYRYVCNKLVTKRYLQFPRSFHRVNLVSITDPKGEIMVNPFRLRELYKELGEALDQVGYALQTIEDIQEESPTREIAELETELDDVYGVLRIQYSRLESFVKNRNK